MIITQTVYMETEEYKTCEHRGMSCFMGLLQGQVENHSRHALCKGQVQMD